MEMSVVMCTARPLSALLCYLSVMALLWIYGKPLMAWLQVYRTPLLFALTVGGALILGADVVLATGPGVGDQAVCQYGWEHGWPCWILQALWCACEPPPPLP